MPSFLDPVFSPLLQIPPLRAVLIVSFVLSVIIIIVYKLMTDQVMMKALKEELKDLQQQMKKLRDNPQKLMKIQKQAMDKNMKYMMHSLKPTFVTFIPIIIIFSWLNGHLAYDPITPGQDFNVTVIAKTKAFPPINLTAPAGITLLSNASQQVIDGQAVWLLKGDAGTYKLSFAYQGGFFEKEVTISEGNDYAAQETKLRGDLKSVKLGMHKKVVLNLFGWRMTWLWSYILFSLIFSMSLRKILKVY